MVKVITQETYDEVVRENINEFSMSPQEAIDDAIAQFSAQGVDLLNIIKDLALSEKTDTHLVVEIISNLNSILNSEEKNTRKLEEELDRLRLECEKDIAHRVMAGREGAYSVSLKAIAVTGDLLETGIKTLNALMNGNPDLLDPSGIDLLISSLSKTKKDSTITLLLKWAATCCVKHERNRQRIFDAGILSILCPLLHGNRNQPLLREACTLIRHLVMDDDVRVEFGKAHDHARLIAQDTLPRLTSMLTDFKQNEGFVSELLLTLASLLVRHEFCVIVEEAGGLQFILDVLVDFHESDRLVRQSFKLLKAMAGHDDVKRNIIRNGAAPLITSCLDRHKSSEKTVIAGLSCVAAVALREPTNGEQLFESGIPDVIVQCMLMYPDSIDVQKNGSWAIRNMVYRNRDQSQKFLDLGVEEILNDSLRKFEKVCGFDIKSALRDLGCIVKFDEQWTGKGTVIPNDAMDDTER